MNLAARAVPEFMRALLGDDIFNDVQNITLKLSELELRGVISTEWHLRFMHEIADEVLMQKIANDIGADCLTDEAACPDTPTSCGHSNCDSSTR